jgi:predicted Zn-ribbon and HTH transcriptional regulator
LNFGHCDLFDIYYLGFGASSVKLPRNQGETMPTVRQKIIALLTEAEMDARELSREVRIREKEVYEHLTHISRSLEAKGRKISIRPCECLQCSYVFKDRKRFTRPGRCPRCRATRITHPSFKIS